MRPMSIIRFLLCLFIMPPAAGYAADGFTFRFIRLPGHVQNTIIHEATADSHGLLWFYNTTGLHRYDGNQVLTFDLVSKPSIHHNSINRLVIDRQDNIWMGTRIGLVKFDTRKWATTVYSPAAGEKNRYANTVIKAISAGSDSSIYLATEDSRLYRVSGKRLQVVMDFKNAAVWPRGDKNITLIAEPLKDQIWVLHNGRLHKIRRNGNGYTKEASYPMPEIAGDITPQTIFHPSGKIVFYAAQSGIYLFDPATGRTTPLPAAVQPDNEKKGRPKLLLLPSGQIAIFYNEQALFLYDINTCRLTASDDNLIENFRHNHVTFMSNQGQKIFFSYDKGIAEVTLQHSPFRNLLQTASHETASHSVRSIYAAAGGSLYISSYKEGFFRLDPDGKKTPISNAFVYRILPWKKDSLLLATEGSGLQWFHTGTQRMQPAAGDTSVLHYATALVRENDSLVWAGTYKGAFLYHSRTGVITTPDIGPVAQQLRDSKVNDILIAGNRRYFATVSGLYVYTPATGFLRRLLPETPADVFNCLQQVNGLLWAGTNGRGLYCIDSAGQIVREYNTRNGLAGNNVYTLAAQGQTIIAGTDQGLSVISEQRREIRSYSRIDNLPADEFNHAAIFVYADRLYMGTLNGITTFTMPELEQYRQSAIQPQVCFTSFATGNRDGLKYDYRLPYRSTPSLTVTPDINFFSLSFGSADQYAALLNYYYRLSASTPWQEIGQKHEISIAGISPGNYTVEVAMRRPGENNIQPLLQIPLTVQPAFYVTWWFRLAVLAATGGLIWLFFRYRMAQLLKEQQLRTQIAGDLHDEIGSTLTRIYYQADMLSMKPDDRHAIQKIADSSKEALGVMSDMVWSIDSRFDTAADLVSRIKDFLRKTEEELDIDCSIKITGNHHARPLSQMIRQNFLQVFKEAVNNAARHAGSPAMTVNIHFAGDMTLEVSNPAAGNTDRIRQYQGGQGIYYMQLRTARMKGRLDIIQEEDTFTLRLTVPL
ncbi:sensor histidine kinase [Chitinophaga solisilvae]|uniref:sensor histidine kinase n=1 Tax=Chitinophaga solisilvae TaxID=1233460 RepID=UPI00136D8EED|nr:histidine kinase [Chitinophaga solisilvae]